MRESRFTDLLAAEWIKLWSLRSIPYGLALLAVVVVGVNVNGSLSDYGTWPQMSPDQQTGFYALKDAFSNSSFLILMLGAGAIGAIVIVSEYSTGLIRTTFAAVPARRSVILAKIAVVAAVFTLAGVLIASISFAASQSILAGRPGAALSITDPGVLRATIGSALLMPVCALTGMAMGVLLRHTATTVVVTTALLMIVPNFFDERGGGWDSSLYHATPYGAWQRLINIDPQSTIPGVNVDSVGHAFLMLAIWSAVAIVIPLAMIQRRDV
jgi:ABC-2 type transport system permease protein